MDEFDLYCQSKTEAQRALLRPVRGFIGANAPALNEARVHFYLTYNLGPMSVVKLHLGAKGLPCLTFPAGDILPDPQKLLKGKTALRMISLLSEKRWAKYEADIAAILAAAVQSATERWDGVTQMTPRDRLARDQASP